MGLFLQVQRKGKTGLKEPSWNTKGVAKSFKFYFKAYKEMEVERAERAADLARRERDLQQEKAKLGLPV